MNIFIKNSQSYSTLIFYFVNISSRLEAEVHSKFYIKTKNGDTDYFINNLTGTYVRRDLES